MSMLMKKLLGGCGYLDQTGDGTGSGGGGGGGETPEAKAAREAAEAAEAAKKAAEEEAARKKAEEDKNKSTMTDKEAALLKDVMKKKDALEAATKAKEELEAKLKDFEGLDPIAIKKLMAEHKAKEEEELVRKGEWEKIKAQMNQETEKALKAKDSVIAEKEGVIKAKDEVIANLTVGSSFTGSKFISEELALTPTKARVIYGAHFEFKDGAIVAYDKPAGSKDRAPLVDGKGNPLPFDEALKKIVDADPEKDAIYKSKVAPGANSGTQSKGGPAKKDNSTTLTGLAKIEAALATK